MDDSTPDTDKGFGTGLRRQLERRRDGEEAAEAPREAPAHVVAEEILADIPVASSQNGSSSDDVEAFRAELSSALARERDLRAAMAEQAAMLERELAGPQGLNLRAAELDQRAATLASRENEIASRDQELSE